MLACVLAFKTPEFAQNLRIKFRSYFTLLKLYHAYNMQPELHLRQCTASYGRCRGATWTHANGSRTRPTRPSGSPFRRFPSAFSPPRKEEKRFSCWTEIPLGSPEIVNEDTDSDTDTAMDTICENLRKISKSRDEHGTVANFHKHFNTLTIKK